jgi:hypothetical protein
MYAREHVSLADAFDPNPRRQADGSFLRIRLESTSTLRPSWRGRRFLSAYFEQSTGRSAHTYRSDKDLVDKSET